MIKHLTYSLFFATAFLFAQENGEIIYSIQLKENDSIDRNIYPWEDAIKRMASDLKLKLVYKEDEAHLKILENSDYKKFIDEFEYPDLVLHSVFGFYRYRGEIWQEKDTNYQFRPKAMFVDDCIVEIEPNHKWKVVEEEKEILGYSCKKATLNFTYYNNKNTKHYKVKAVAWFTEDLPYPFSPMYSTNLPGLIFEVSFKNVSYGLTKIEYKPVKITEVDLENTVTAEDDERMTMEYIGKQ